MDEVRGSASGFRICASQRSTIFRPSISVSSSACGPGMAVIARNSSCSACTLESGRPHQRAASHRAPARGARRSTLFTSVSPPASSHSLRLIWICCHDSSSRPANARFAAPASPSKQLGCRIVDLALQGRGKGLALHLRQPAHRPRGTAPSCPRCPRCPRRLRCRLGKAVLVPLSAAAVARLVATWFVGRLRSLLPPVRRRGSARAPWLRFPSTPARARSRPPRRRRPARRACRP
jgi:hypothetical protein